MTGDSDTVEFINTHHHYVDTPAAATKAALEAGTDLESWTVSSPANYYRDIIPVMLRNGSLAPSLVDRAVSRLLTLRFRAGLFDKYEAQHFAQIRPEDRGTEQFAEIALDAARQSLTLLRNADETLPLKPGGAVALIGPYLEYGVSQGTLSAELSRLNGGNATVAAVEGCAVAGNDRSGFAAAVAAALASKTVVQGARVNG